MKNAVKKFVAIFCVIITIMTGAPLTGFIGTLKASAAGAYDVESVYTYMAQIILNYNYNGAAKLGDTTLPNLRLNRFMDPSICSVSRPTVNELNSDTAFVISANAWKVATFDLSEMLNSFEEEVGYYQAIILNVLNSAIEYSIIPSTVTSYTKNITAIQKNIDKYKLEGLNTALGVNLWNSQLTPDEALDLYNKLEIERVKVNNRITDATDLSGIINGTMSVLDVIEKFAAHAAVADLSENIKAVIDELYMNCPSSNLALKAALLEVKTVMKSTLDRIGVDLTNAIWQAGKVAIESALSELWVGALESVVGNLAAGILIGQVIGKAVCNMMFSTDSIIEQWYKLNALVEFEDVMYSTVNSLGNKFKSNSNEENALVFLSAIEILGNMYIEDYNMSEDLVEYVYEKGLWNNIKKGFQKMFNTYDDSEIVLYHENIASLKTYVNDLYEITKPDFYTSWMVADNKTSDDGEKSKTDMAKMISVKCPTDVEVYDSENNIVVSIKNNEITHLALGIYTDIVNSEKTIYLSEDDDYSVEITGTDTGTMEYVVTEVEDNVAVRSVVYEDVPLTEGTSYLSSMTLKKYEDSKNYNLKCEDGTEIEKSYDSLPPVKNEFTDVIVAEELFDGFSVELIDLVADTMFNMKSVVDLSAYDISTDDSVALFSAVAKYYPAEYSLIANSDFTYKIIVSPNLDRIMKIRFYYGDDANLSTYQKRVNDLNAEIDDLVAKVEGMNDFEKALYIHDYIVLNSEYDLELLKYMEDNNFILPGELRSEKYTEYSILVNGTGVCGSYALAYRAVLNAAGMECLYLSSESMNHAWNMVKVDGNWYHVDCCWDDPVPDTYGRARRTYFLRTDKEIMDLNHYSWTPGQYKAKSEKYSDMPRNYDIKQKYDDGKWYYLVGSTLYSSDEYGENEIEITSISASSIDVDSGIVYFSNGRYIYEYDMKTEEKDLVYMLSNKDSGEKPLESYLSNIYVDENNVEFYKSIYSNDKRVTVFDTDTLQREKFNAITGIEISHSEVSLEVFETLQLSSEIITTGSTEDLEVEWHSSNNAVVKVDVNGKITGANVGTAIIEARVMNFVASCEVTVNGDGLSGMCGQNVVWKYDATSKVLSFSGTGEMDYFPEYTYSIRKEVEHVIIEDGVESIGDMCCEGCSNLEDIYIGDSVKEIRQGAFAYCPKLTKIVIPDSVIYIHGNAFASSENITQVVLGASTQIDEWNTFNDMPGLKEIVVPENNPNYRAIEGVLFSFDGTELIIYPQGKENQSYTVPLGTISIGCGAFAYNSSLKELKLSDSVRTLRSGAFRDCNIVNISMNEGLTTIESDAFYGLSYLEEIFIPSSVDTIHYGVFSYCTKLKKIVVDQRNDYFVSDVFGCLYSIDDKTLIAYPAGSLETSYCVADGTRTIWHDAFSGNSYIENVDLPQSLTTIGSRAFSNCSNLKCVNLPGGLKDIWTGAFAYCFNLENITVPASTSVMNGSSSFGPFYGVDNVFYKGSDNNAPWGAKALNGYSENGLIYSDRSLKVLEGCSGSAEGVVSLPKSCTSIEKGAFFGCKKIKSIIIPDETTLLGDSLFGESNRCYELKYLMFGKGVKSITSFSEYSGSTMKTEKILIDNPDCEINANIYYATIYGHENSTAQTYAEKRNLNFVNIDAEHHIHDYFLMGYKGATETEDGYEYYECYCGKSNYTTTLHYYGEEFITNPSCTVDGVKSKTCLNCGVADIVETIPAVGRHKYQLISTVMGDCTTVPIHTYECSVCHDTYTKEGKIEEGHNYEKIIVLPTCDEGGYTKEVCTDCGETILTDFTSPKGHEFFVNRSVNYCLDHSIFEYACKNCDYIEKVVADTENLVTQTVTVEPTCTNSGVITEICTLCRATVSTEILPALSHDYSKEWTTDVVATCLEAGSESQHCSRCDAKRAVREIGLTDHKDENSDKRCDVCGEFMGGFVILTGSVKSYSVGGGDESVTSIELFTEGEEKAVYNTLVGGAGIQSFEISDVAEGTYTVVVSKDNHVKREYEIIVDPENTVCSFEICLRGDVNGDGKINVMDYTKILKHTKKLEYLEGYQFICADVDFNGKISVIDYTKILRHVKKTEMLW